MRTAVYTSKTETARGMVYIGIFAIGFPLIHLLLGFSLDAWLDSGRIMQNSELSLTGIPVALFGIYLILSSTHQLIQRGHGLPLSSCPPNVLVTAGPYRWSRHPIYLGAAILLAGIFIGQSSPWGLILATPMLALFYAAYARGIEEPVLLQRYGPDYQRYRETVPLFIPYPFRKSIHRILHLFLGWISHRANHPGIKRFGDHIFFWGYGIWPGLGVMIGLGVSEYLLLAQGIPAPVAAGIVVAMTVVGLAGVRLTWRIISAIKNGLHFRSTSGQVGFMSWGVLLNLIIVVLLFSVFTPYPAYYLLDASLPGILMAHFWGRIGCTFYGCCHGKSSAYPCAIHYHHHALKLIRTGNNSARDVIPIQLLSSLYGLAGSLLIVGLWTHHSLVIGFPAALGIFWYGAFRLDEEWLREQSIIWLHFISPAQLVSFGLMLIGLTWLLIGDPTAFSTYQPLSSGHSVFDILRQMHPLLLVLGGLITTLLFSYHYREVGKWE